MSAERKGNERREALLRMMRAQKTPLSGTELGRLTGVSRQVVVQDIALLRTEGYQILSTARGYVLAESDVPYRVIKVCHTDAQVEDELTRIVDLGGKVCNVMINHRIYGKVDAPLNIRNRRDIKSFMKDLQTGRSTPLLNVTSGYHFHKIEAESEEILDEIEEELRSCGYLAEVLPYEKEGPDGSIQ